MPVGTANKLPAVHADDKSYAQFSGENKAGQTRHWRRRVFVLVVFLSATAICFYKIRLTRNTLPLLRRGSMVPDPRTSEQKDSNIVEPAQRTRTEQISTESRFDHKKDYMNEKAVASSHTTVFPIHIESNSSSDSELSPEQKQRIQEISKQWSQQRDSRRFGKGPDYVDMNTFGDKVAIRRARYEALEKFKQEHCGGFAQYLGNTAAATDSGNTQAGASDTNWRQHRCSKGCKHSQNTNEASDLDKLLYLFNHYCDSGKSMMDGNCKMLGMPIRHVCQGPHPTRKETTITMERLGPFRTGGGYDWTSVIVNDLGELSEKSKAENMVLVGGMMGPVAIDGTVIGHPPIHIHHAHVYPYADIMERAAKIRGSNLDHHDVMFQAHGDSECKPEDGGLACLLHELDEGEGFIVDHAKSGMGIDIELNDVRPEGSEPFEWYLDVIIMHQDQLPKKNATYLGLSNKCIEGPCTYPLTLDPSSSLNWYNYKHKNLGAGWMKNWILHTHMAYADTMVLIKGHGVREAVEKFADNKTPPVFLECHQDGKYKNVDAASQALFDQLLEIPGAQLICEMTKPGIDIRCPVNSTEPCHVWDKRSKANCLKDPVRIEPGEELTAIAFNTVRPHKVSRGSHAFRHYQAYTPMYVGLQHSVFRADFINDPANDYTPPSYFYYAGVLAKDESEVFYNNAAEADALFFSTCPKSTSYSFQP